MDDRIVIFGQSCVGKTTFAQTLPLPYVCFDALFPWHEVETLCLPTTVALEHVRDSCGERFVLDGWHLADVEGEFLPDNVCVYVLFAEYARIIDQYRVPVERFDQHVPMYESWYRIDYSRFDYVRYWHNDGRLEEVDEAMFQRLVASQLALLKT